MQSILNIFFCAACFVASTRGTCVKELNETYTWISKIEERCQPEICSYMYTNGTRQIDTIIRIARNGTQHQWSCLHDLVLQDPRSNVLQKKFTAPCIKRSNEWNWRDDSVKLLRLNMNPRNQKMLLGLTSVILLFVQATMLCLGCEIDIEGITKYAKSPEGAIIAVVCQFGVMPLGAFIISYFLKLDFYAAIALIICGCCPGGNMSNLLAYGVKGDMNLSILMTTCSSVLGLGLMPLMIWVYGGWTKAIHKINKNENGVEPELTIPYLKIVVNIVLTVLPCAVGIWIANRCTKATVARVQRIAGGCMTVIAIGALTLVVLLFGYDFPKFFDPIVIVACAILPLVGYLFGYCIAILCGQKSKLARTISVETGCQNVQLCTIILRTGFPWCDSGIYFLLPVLYLGFQFGWALIAVGVVRLFLKETEVEEPDKINLASMEPMRHVEYPLMHGGVHIPDNASAVSYDTNSLNRRR